MAAREGVDQLWAAAAGQGEGFNRFALGTATSCRRTPRLKELSPVAELASSLIWMSTVREDDIELDARYCSIVGSFEHPFTTDDAAVDERLRHHRSRHIIRSYCGVPLRTVDGAGLGTLCHFDLVPCDVPAQEIQLMEAAARLIVPSLERALIGGRRLPER